ncbi:MAG: GNAT family N-acetyltransferase [Oscillospiraceae bacterium]|nr:GNAT family N-acetyltransferase [Oscillospiraceae bacterium]
MFIDIKNRISEPVVRQIIAAAVFDDSDEGLNQWEARIMGRDSQKLYAWVDNDKIVGVCNFEAHSDFAEILTIAVAENFRGRGVGYAMILALKDKYKMNIEAETDDNAVNFYRKCNFETTAIRKYDVRRWTCVLYVTDN